MDKNSIFEPVTIICKDDFKWIEIRPISKPERVNLDIKILNENKLLIDWDLLKINEELEFEALVECKIEKEDILSSWNFHHSLSFDFRITDLKQIEKEDLFQNKIKQNPFLSFPFSFSITIAIIGFVFLLFGEYYNHFKPSIINVYTADYKIFSINDTIISPIKIVDNDMLKFNFKNHDTTLLISDFNKTYKINSINNIKKESQLIIFIRISYMIYITLGLFGIFRRYNQKRIKNKKL